MRLYRNPVSPVIGAMFIALTLAGCGAAPATLQSAQGTVHEAAKKNRRGQDSLKFVTITGEITNILPDDLQGSKHQLFLLEVSVQGKVQSVKCAHNIDLAPRVPLEVGDDVQIKGEYIDEKPHDIIHWTHHNPRGGEGGWIRHEGKIYQ